LGESYQKSKSSILFFFILRGKPRSYLEVDFDETLCGGRLPQGGKFSAAVVIKPNKIWEGYVLHTLAGVKNQCKPYYIEGVETYEDAMRHEDWSGSTLGVRCPKCDQLFLIFYNKYMDDYGEYKKVWGFCTNCNNIIEAVINK
jgi:hypothetical protein